MLAPRRSAGSVSPILNEGLIIMGPGIVIPICWLRFTTFDAPRRGPCIVFFTMIPYCLILKLLLSM